MLPSAGPHDHSDHSDHCAVVVETEAAGNSAAGTAAASSPVAAFASVVA